MVFSFPSPPPPFLPRLLPSVPVMVKVYNVSKLKEFNACMLDLRLQVTYTISDELKFHIWFDEHLCVPRWSLESMILVHILYWLTDDLMLV